MKFEKVPNLGESPSLARDVAFALADLYLAAGTHIKAPNPALHVSAQGDLVKLGICVAADALCKVLARHEEGLVALGDLVNKPRLNDLQGK